MRCDCLENSFCPHLGQQLVGRIYQLAKEDSPLGRKYRAMWAEKAGTASPKKKIILSNKRSPGDICVSTAAIYCLHEQYPNEYLTDYRSCCNSILENNPDITPIQDNEGETFEFDYPLVNQSHVPHHFLQGYLAHLADLLGIKLYLTVNRPMLYLSKEEKIWNEEKYIVLNAGYKFDIETKKWTAANWKEVVKAMPLPVYQVGEINHNHPFIDGCIDLRGKTNHRELMKLIAHAALVFSPESFSAHLAAAFQRPCVLLASGFAPISWISYPTTRIISKHGILPCNRFGSCWKGKVSDKGTGAMCELPVLENGEHVAKCMQMISPDEVIIAALEFLENDFPRPALP